MRALDAQFFYRLAPAQLRQRLSHGRGQSERIAERLRRWGMRAALCALFVLFVGVRFYHLDRAPEHNATTDEYAWTWSGMTFFKDGEPTGWSNLKAYEKLRKTVRWRDHKYLIVRPWLDHPPLYSFFAGGVMHLQGYRDMYDVDLWRMRLGSLFLDAVSFILLSLVLGILATGPERLIALLLFSVLPLVVLHQRLVVSENMIVPLTLGAVLLTLYQRRRYAIWRSVLLFLIAVMLPLTKVAGLSASVFLTMWTLACTPQRSRFVNAGCVALGTVLGIGGYIAWGRHFGPELFNEVMNNHQGRFKGFSGLEVLLFEPKYIAKHVPDLLTVIGCALALGSLAQPRPTAWGLAVLSYAACMAFFADDHRVFGWYFIPLYPWLCAALGVWIARAMVHRELGPSLLWCTVAALAVATVLFGNKLLETQPLRVGYLAGILAIYGSWLAWPRFARMSIPAVNGAMLAATTCACLYDLYTR
jgi:hypothetical protein